MDGIKIQIFNRVANPAALHFSADLPPVWYEQFASERAVVRYSRGRSVRQFVRIAGRRVEALACLADSYAARGLVTFNPDDRCAELAGQASATLPAWPVVARSSWMTRGR